MQGISNCRYPQEKQRPPPVGPALGQHGVNIMDFTKAFNEKTAQQAGLIIPVVITVYADRSFSFVTKTPPAAVLIKKGVQDRQSFRCPGTSKRLRRLRAQLEEIATLKCPT